MRPNRLAQQALLVALVGLLGVFLLYPVWLTVRGGFAADAVGGTGWTLDHVGLVFRDPVLREGLWNAFAIALGTTTLCFLIGLPLAFFGARHTFPLKRLWSAAVLVPLILPPFVGAIGLKAILGRSGALNALLGTHYDFLGTARFWGVVVALALHLYPIIYLNASAALANLDPALDEAAETVGCGPLRRFFLITLPLIRPGLFAGGAVVFIWSFTELGTPLMFEYYNVTAVQIFSGIKDMNSSAQPFALTAVLLVSAALIYAVGRVLFGKAGHAMSVRATRAGQLAPLGGTAGLTVSGAFALITLLALVPHIGVVLMSFSAPGGWYDSVTPREWTLENFRLALGHPLAFSAITNSLKLASSAMVIDVLLGLGIGYLIARTKVKGRGLLDALSMLPLAVPGLVMAFGYVAMTLRWPLSPGSKLPLGIPNPLAGALDIVGSDPNPFPLLIIAYGVRRLPYIVRATAAGLQQITPDLEQAAANLGASAMTTLRRIVTPLIMANLVAGGLLVFAFSMLEVSDSLILAQQERHYPITKAILAFTERLGDGVNIACGMGVWGMLLLTVTLAGASILLGKSLGALFRA